MFGWPTHPLAAQGGTSEVVDTDSPQVDKASVEIVI
jgi:hypothetical protein